MKKLATLLAATATAAACSGDASRQSTEPSAAPISAPEARVSASRATLGDVSSRIIAGSDVLAANSALVDAIGAVNDALDRADARALTSALTRADRALTRLATADQSNAAELDAIRLALDDARRLLDAP